MARFAFDNFAGAPGTELSAYSANWVQHPSSSISSYITNASRVRGSSASGGGSVYYNIGAPASADYSVSAPVFEASQAMYGAGVLARCNTVAATFYMARWYTAVSPNVVQLFKFIAGTPTQLGPDVVDDLTTGGTADLKLECIGSAIKVYTHGSSTASISVTDSSITAAGKSGIRLGYGGSSTPSDTACLHLAGFSADDIGGGIALSSSAIASATGSGALSVSIPIIGASTVITTGQGTMGVGLSLAAAGSASVVGSATLNTNQALSSSAVAAAAGQGTLGIAQAISGSGVATAQGTGALSLSIPISSAALANAIGSGTLSGSAALASSAVAGVAGQGTISLSLALSSSAIANAVGSGNLGLNGALQGQGVAQAIGQGTLTQLIPISGASLSATNGSGTLSQIVPISSSSVVLASGQGALHITVNMNAAALSQALGVGNLTLRISLSGYGLANAIGSGILGGMHRPINPEYFITGNSLVRYVRGNALRRVV